MRMAIPAHAKLWVLDLWYVWQVCVFAGFDFQLSRMILDTRAREGPSSTDFFLQTELSEGDQINHERRSSRRNQDQSLIIIINSIFKS